jgi:hypothetical protein
MACQHFRVGNKLYLPQWMWNWIFFNSSYKTNFFIRFQMCFIYIGIKYENWNLFTILKEICWTIFRWLKFLSCDMLQQTYWIWFVKFLSIDYLSVWVIILRRHIVWSKSSFTKQEKTTIDKCSTVKPCCVAMPVVTYKTGFWVQFVDSWILKLWLKHFLTQPIWAC